MFWFWIFRGAARGLHGKRIAVPRAVILLAVIVSIWAGIHAALYPGPALPTFGIHDGRQYGNQQVVPLPLPPRGYCVSINMATGLPDGLGQIPIPTSGVCPDGTLQVTQPQPQP